MRAGLEKNLVRRALGALLLSAVLLVAGATAASAGGYGSDGDDCAECPTPPPSSVPHDPPTPTTPPAPHYGPSYPVPSVPPGTPNQPPPSSPPVLARTGSDNGTLVGIGAGALAVGGGLVFFARKRRLATVPA